MACGWAVRSAAAQGPAVPRQKISASELYTRLADRFPVRFTVAGLLALKVDAASLLLLPPRQKLGATLSVQGTGLGGQRLEAGEMDVAFALRYERSDRTLRALDPEVLDLRWPGLQPDAAAVLRGTLPDAARDAIGEVVVHQFSDRELALPDTMGFEPGKLEVLDDGLLIVFQPKQARG